MPTFHVVCVKCRKDKWPTLPERPLRYVCVLCTAQGPERRQKLREAGYRLNRAKKSRRGTSEHGGIAS